MVPMLIISFPIRMEYTKIKNSSVSGKLILIDYSKGEGRVLPFFVYFLRQSSTPGSTSYCRGRRSRQRSSQLFLPVTAIFEFFLRIEDFNRKSTTGARMVPYYQEGVWNFWEHLFHLGFHEW